MQLAIETTLAISNLLPEEERNALGDLEAYAQQAAEQQMEGYFNRWFVSFLASDPAPDWAQTTVLGAGGVRW